MHNQNVMLRYTWHAGRCSQNVDRSTGMKMPEDIAELSDEVSSFIIIKQQVLLVIRMSSHVRQLSCCIYHYCTDIT